MYNRALVSIFDRVVDQIYDHLPDAELIGYLSFGYLSLNDQIKLQRLFVGTLLEHRTDITQQS